MSAKYQGVRGILEHRFAHEISRRCVAYSAVFRNPGIGPRVASTGRPNIKASAEFRGKFGVAGRSLAAMPGSLRNIGAARNFGTHPRRAPLVGEPVRKSKEYRRCAESRSPFEPPSKFSLARSAHSENPCGIWACGRKKGCLAPIRGRGANSSPARPNRTGISWDPGCGRKFHKGRRFFWRAPKLNRDFSKSSTRRMRFDGNR